MTKPNSLVNPVHLEDFHGRQFERLVFAYLLRIDRWRTLEWYGQQGSDSGRDIWGLRDDDSPSGQSVCIQCANHRRLSLAKIKQDIARAIAAPHGVPSRFIVVAGRPLSAQLRDQSKRAAKEAGIMEYEAWSSEEFEERLRAHAESFLKRFIDGAPFPDSPQDLRIFVSALSPTDDNEILSLIAREFPGPPDFVNTKHPPLESTCARTSGDT
jgi:hypothetical protein